AGQQAPRVPELALGCLDLAGLGFLSLLLELPNRREAGSRLLGEHVPLAPKPREAHDVVPAVDIAVHGEERALSHLLCVQGNRPHHKPRRRQGKTGAGQSDPAPETPLSYCLDAADRALVVVAPRMLLLLGSEMPARTR